MEFFIPGITIMFITIYISSRIIPKVTPLIAAVLSIIFLIFGVYEHYQLFASEYRLSTWQEGMKAYAPAVMIVATFIFISYSSFSLFENGIEMPKLPQLLQMPQLPQMPKIDMSPISESISNISSSFSNKSNSRNNSNSEKEPKISRSYLETL